jgi:transcription elongation factor GreB
MRKSSTPRTGADPDHEHDEPLPLAAKNYMTPGGFAALQKEMRFLTGEERPRVVEIVSWAASLGDRSENGDYLYNKKRLREIDRRIRYLTKRLETAEVVDPRRQQHLEQVFFGATVTYAHDDGRSRTVTLVGVDEADLAAGKINWASPVGQLLLKARIGDTLTLRTTGPGQSEIIEVLAVSYDSER